MKGKMKGNRFKAILLIAVFMMSIFVVSFPVIADSPLYWVKASGGGGFYNVDPDHYGDHITIGLNGISLSAAEQGVETAYKGSGVFVDHSQRMIVHLDITEGRLMSNTIGSVNFYGTARVKDLELRDKWTGTFEITLGHEDYGDIFGITLFDENGFFVATWLGILDEGEVNVWIWE